MNDYRRLIGGIAAGAVLVPLLIGLLAELPASIYLTVMAVLLVAVVVYAVWKKPAPPPRQQPTFEERVPRRDPDPPRPPAPTTTPLESALPSSAESYRFQISAVVSWRPVGSSTEHPDPDALARDAVRARAAALTRQYSLVDLEDAVQALQAALGSSETNDSKALTAWASEIALTADADDVDRVRIMATVRKQKEVFEYQREHERDVRTYLGDDALTTTGSTLVWWLTKNPGRFDETVARLNTFARVSAVAQGRDDPGPDPGTLPEHGLDRPSGFRIATAPGDERSIRRLIEDLLPDADDDERGMFADDLARSADERGRPDLAERLRRPYPIQRLDEQPATNGRAEPTEPEESSDTVSEEDPGSTEDADREQPSSGDPETE